jgi:hypothetical protein
VKRAVRTSRAAKGLIFTDKMRGFTALQDDVSLRMWTTYLKFNTSTGSSEFQVD